MLAKAAYDRRKNRIYWIALLLRLVAFALLGLTGAFCYSWLATGASGYPVLVAGIAFLAVGTIAVRAQEYFDRRDFDGPI